MQRTELEFIGPKDDCPNPEFWSARDAEASEWEVGDFLYGLIRLIKPEIVLETGCYMGDTSAKIAQALEANGRGHLFSCDTLSDRVEQAWAATTPGRASFSSIAGIDLIHKTYDVDLAFIDSNGDRVEECKALNMKPGGFVILHDSRWKTFEPIREWGWTEIFFPTPRGISLFKVNHAKT